MFNINLTGEFVAFFVFSVIIITGAVLMVSFTKVVYMVVSLEAEFLAFVQVLIYAGAISILMIFGIMMTRHEDSEAEKPRPLQETLTAIGALALFGILFYAIRQSDFQQPQQSLQAGADNTMEIGKRLFTDYIVPFELVSVLLTVAFIGAIVLAKKEAD
jgi:NADH-quinone oxidoreductase subunit J